MIIVRLMGGHSNQLFQYATGRRLADKRGVELLLDLTYLENTPKVDTPRHYELGSYPICARRATQSELNRILPLDFKPTLPFKITWRLGLDRRIRPINEMGKAFNDRVLNVRDNTYLFGWWQNERYFIDIRDKLLREFEPKTPMTAKNKEYLKKISTTQSISLHVRREDYVTNEHANEVHGLTPLDYYHKAITRVTNLSADKDPHIFVFCKEIEWCKANLEFKLPTTFVEGNTQGADDMRLMKHCKHNILTNSSFSWWGAWLNQNPRKIVIAPKVWLQDKGDNTKVELPQNWIRL